ncbi:MAG TPA: YcaO-like family protein [Nitrososphaeraceae archaeon]|nr:YcaO-like family protein [Nitrososphaeraceae archaeon]
MFKSSLSSSICLNSIKKCITNNGYITPRVKPLEYTLAKIIPICKDIGVTRISDITYMDKLYIPNFSAILPGTEDSIWVYSGKGLTKQQAKTSSLMESIERYCSLPSIYSKSLIHGTYLELSKTYKKVLHPNEVVEPVESNYNDKESIIDYIQGFDLLKNEEVLVPAQLVFSKFSAKAPSINIFPYSHTNGLASGNVLEEAICHGLCEVIERDAVSIADLCSSSIPYSILENILKSLKNSDYSPNLSNQIPEDKFVDDANIYPEVNISEIVKEFEPIKFLVRKFIDAGISLLIKDITQKDIDIPTFVASSIEWVTNDYGYFAKGYGTHPDSRIALIRAITELSQTRAVNIQGARDDLKRIQYRDKDEIYKRKWQFIASSPSSSSTQTNNNKNIAFSEIKTYIKKDILDDIKLILNKLKKAGLKRAIVVNLTNSNVGIPVVRIIVPGLETFEVAKIYTDTNLIFGKRARKQFWKIQHP